MVINPAEFTDEVSEFTDPFEGVGADEMEVLLICEQQEMNVLQHEYAERNARRLGFTPGDIVA